MRRASNSSHRGLSRRGKIALGLLVPLLCAAGLYLGRQLYSGGKVDKPLPKPDIASLTSPSRHDAELAAQGGGLELGIPPPFPMPESLPRERAGDLSSHLEVRVPNAEPDPEPLLLAGPKVAIVIDDLGRSLRDLETLINIGAELTYAVLPFESRTPLVVAALRRHGVEILCHLPMEAKGGADPGPGALRLEMSPDELRTATRQALAAVPGAVGVNNHMGSGISARRQSIHAVLGVVAEQDLYYLDSRTSADTLGLSEARSLGIASAERQVFLDSDRHPAAIRAQFERLLGLARRRGVAIAIAHPHPETLRVLAEEIPKAKAAGIEFVRASRLMGGSQPPATRLERQ